MFQFKALFIDFRYFGKLFLGVLEVHICLNPMLGKLKVCCKDSHNKGLVKYPLN